ncbi:Hemocytin-like, partial [Tropilaelaps mercedesae]
DICPVPAAPKRSRVQCRKGRGKRMCKANCLDGFRLPDGGTEQIIVCSEDEGTYTPTEAFVDCEAHCDAPCQNGGKCLGNDKCVCEADFRGNQCEYPVSLCDGHFSEFHGTWRCSHLKNGTVCNVECPYPFYFSFESPNVHRCTVEGVWTPEQVPTCITDDPDLELVPGEVTRDEVEQKIDGQQHRSTEHEYEILEFFNAGKPVAKSNAVVIEEQDATSNIVRRKKCPEGEERVKCASNCQPTCEQPDIVCPPVADDQCAEGCACPEGSVRHKQSCVPRKACPCYHQGFPFANNHYIVQDCNTWSVETG